MFHIHRNAEFKMPDDQGGYLQKTCEIVSFVVNLLNIYASFRGGVSTKIHLKNLLRMKIRRKIILRMENHREIFLSASNLKSSNVIGQIRSLTIII